MFEPHLEHNREEFQRLKRLEIGVALGGIASAFLFAMLVALLSPPRWVEWLGLPLVFAVLIALVALEVRKTLVFRRDLRERRAHKDSDSR